MRRRCVEWWWCCNPVFLGSRPPFCHKLDLFSVVPSSTPWQPWLASCKLLSYFIQIFVSCTRYTRGRCCGLMVNTLNSGTSGSGSSNGRGRCVAWHLTPTLPRSTQEYKRVSTNGWGNRKKCSGNLRGTTPSHFMLPGKAPAVVGHWAREDHTCYTLHIRYLIYTQTVYK